MFLTPSFKKSLVVEQFHGNYLKLSNLGRFSNDDSDAETDEKNSRFYRIVQCANGSENVLRSNIQLHRSIRNKKLLQDLRNG